MKSKKQKSEAFIQVIYNFSIQIIQFKKSFILFFLNKLNNEPRLSIKTQQKLLKNTKQRGYSNP